MSIYQEGQLVTLQASFAVSGIATDPTTVNLFVQAPSGATLNPSPTRITAGVYQYPLTLSQTGLWSYRWEANGAVQTDGQQTIIVAPISIPGIA